MLSHAVTLKHLRALLAVGEHRSLTAAAEALHQTTPAIHSQIHKLQDLVGRPLLTREADGTGFALTPAGEAVARAARRIEASLSQAEAEMAAISRGYTGHVRLSVVSTGKYIAPGLVRRLRDQVPEIEVTLRVGNRTQVIADLETGMADLAIMGRPPRVPEVRADPLGPHPHGIILPPGHPLARDDGFDPTALLDETFIAREDGSGTRMLMARYFDRLAEGADTKLIIMESNETIKQAVMAGLGIAFLSLHTCHDELTTGRLVALRGPGLPLMRHWYLVRAVEREATAATLNLAQRIVMLGGSYLPPALP
ncbi:MAG: LysR family transcriptional regulator [Paracoccaceae bacterium]